MHQPGNSQDVEEKQNYERLNLSHLLHIKGTFLSEIDLTIKTMIFTQTPLSSRKMKRGWNPASSSVSQYAMYAHNDNANIHY